MKKIILLLFVFLVHAGLYALDITVPESVLQGGVVTVIVKDGEGVALSLNRDGVVFSETKSFPYETDGKKLQIGLLGVPSTLASGRYNITAGKDKLNKSISIEEDNFIKEDIELSSDMSDLRQSDDLRKAEQWRELLIILKAVDTEHVYETGLLDKPVQELRISSFYGDRRRFLYDDGTTAGAVHNGIDYSAEPGTPIHAAGKGRVVFSGERIISGLTVVIEHLPGVYSLYYHMNSIAVKEGDMLSAGAPVGTVGATGLATGAHLHWEISVGGVAVNPGPLMSGGIIDKALILGNI